MKTAKKLFSRACVYTVLLSIAVAVSALFGEFEKAIIPLSQYLIILLIGALLSVSQEIFSVKRLRFSLRLLIHYLAVTASLTAIFAFTGKITTSGAADVFVWATIFSLLYGVGFLCYLLLCRLRGVSYAWAIESDAERAKRNATYTPRYK